LLGCLLAGCMNGIGSLFYYSALGRLDAGLGQLLYSLYPLFLVIWMSLDRQPPGRLTVFRIILVIPAIHLITQAGTEKVDWIGVGEMLIASALYALHLPINQRVLYDMPAPTVTLYTLLSMSAVVIPVFLISGASITPGITASVSSASTIQLPIDHYWNRNAVIQSILSASGPLIALALVTFLSRITLFMGVKHLGGMQTALLGLSELLVTIIFAHLWLRERFTASQWIGAVLMGVSLGLIAIEKNTVRKRIQGGILGWVRPPELKTETWHLRD